MKILVSGVTGYVAGYLCKSLIANGHTIVGITRNPDSSRLDFDCDLIRLEDVSSVKGVEAVINLAGASVAGGRWTKAYKKELRNSRVGLTKSLVSQLDQSDLKVFISASAIGYYDDGGSNEIDESSAKFDGFIGDLCDDWEKASEGVSCRRVIFRLGVVLGPGSAALSKMMSIFKIGAGAQLSDGKQYMSFVHIDDLVKMFVSAVSNSNYGGVYNAVSPEPITNKSFTKLLASKMRVPLISPPVPAFALKLLYGEMAQVLLRSHRIIPKRLLGQGFVFKYNSIDKALEDSVG